MTNFKTPKFRSKKHLEFIRSLPCIRCGCSPSQAAHIRKGTDGGISLKPSDNFTVPLCHKHHQEQHKLGEVSFHFDMDMVIGLSSKLYDFTGNKEKCCEEIILYRKKLSILR